MSESGSERPKLTVIKGGRRRFEPPEGFNLEEATEGSQRLHQAIQSEILAEPVRKGTAKMPLLDEHAKAKTLAKEIDSTIVEDNHPGN